MAIYENWDTSDLITSVKLKGALNTDSNTESINNNDNILLIASEELHSRVLPLLMSVREDYYVTSQSITIVAGTSSYQLNNRATGFIVRDVRFTKGNEIRSIPLIRREDVHTSTSGNLEAYYLEHDKIIVFPPPASAEGTLTVEYYWRPNKLTQTSACAQVSSIASNVVTVSSIPSTWATNDIFDLISHKNPYISHAVSQTATTVSGSDVTFASVSSDLVANDWLCPEGESCIPQIPFDARNLLTTATAATILYSIGDKGNGDRLKKEYDDIESKYLNIISPRSVGESKKIMNPNFFLNRYW